MRLQYGQQATAWPTKRTQRCMSFALVFTIIIIVGLYERQSYGRTERQVPVRSIYGSSPEAGMPSLPFVDNNVRRSSGEPLFYDQR
ncbi:hypothetical protein VTL71DRAFT_3081 [Oculimacula yallundae]|uniref:Uncharacterized protein n=1 Tax=Oculimacula yallundae TaxID=86028 RepID=A0ABR4C660_9HELO